MVRVGLVLGLGLGLATNLDDSAPHRHINVNYPLDLIHGPYLVRNNFSEYCLPPSHSFG